MARADDKLTAIRREIDALDADLLSLINRRAELAKKVAQVKDGEGSNHYYRPEREAEVLRALVDGNDGPLPGRDVSRIFQEIMSACRALQKAARRSRISVPQGTFTESAAFSSTSGTPSSRYSASTESARVFREVSNPAVPRIRGRPHRELDRGNRR